MKILHVVASLAPRYGGPSVACPSLCRELARRGHEVAIYTTNVDGRRMGMPMDHRVYRDGVEIRDFPGWSVLGEWKPSPELWRALCEHVATFDVAHIYSVYGFSTTAAAQACWKRGVPYLLHPHGSLDPYLRRRHRWRKWLYSALLVNRDYRRAGAILFNSHEEMRLAADWSGFTRLGKNGSDSPRRVVAYVGVEESWFEKPSAAATENFLKKFPQLEGRRLAVFFGRLNFKKGLDILARAFAIAARGREDPHLVVAGPDSEGFGAQVRQWLAEGGVQEKTTFTGALEGEDCTALLHSAEVFVLPSYTENFGQAVAEAMACGVPVVISDRVNIWPEVARAGAGLVVRCDPAETAAAMSALFENPALGRAMGQRGRRLAEEQMTWKVVGDQMVEIYERLIEGAASKGRALKSEIARRASA